MSENAPSGGVKFAPGESVVKRLEHWHVVVRGKQATLGDVTFVLRRTVSSLGEVTRDEMGELPEAIRWFEGAVDALFAPDRIDYSVMLTHDPHVHLDAFPRYSRAVERYDRTWTDAQWPDQVAGRDIETLSRDQHHRLCADLASQA